MEVLSTLDSCGLVRRCEPFGTIAAKPDAASFSGLECSFGPGRNHFAFMLSDSSKDVQGQSRCVRAITCDELYARVHHRRDKGNVSGQPIQFGNKQLGLVLPARGESLL